MAAADVIARRYAEAYFALARERGEIEAWREQLAAAVRVVTDVKVAAALGNPAIAAEARKSELMSLLRDVSPEARNLMRLMFERGRISVAPVVLDHYDRLADQASGVVRAEVTAAVAVDDGLRQAITETLASRLGGRVQTTVRQDPGIIGGLVIRIGDRVIDCSVQTRLQQLQTALS